MRHRLWLSGALAAALVAGASAQGAGARSQAGAAAKPAPTVPSWVKPKLVVAYNVNIDSSYIGGYES